MNERMIPRREVLAFIALTTDEALAPEEVRFYEYIDNEGKACRVITLTVETETAVRFWAAAFGHGEYGFHMADNSSTDGERHWTTYSSTDTGWRGFTTEVNARVYKAADVPLDETTRDQLREIVGVAS